MLDILLNIGLFLLGGVTGGFYVGRKMMVDIDDLIEANEELITAKENADNHLRKLGVKDGE